MTMYVFATLVLPMITLFGSGMLAGCLLMAFRPARKRP